MICPACKHFLVWRWIVDKSVPVCPNRECPVREVDDERLRDPA